MNLHDWSKVAVLSLAVAALGFAPAPLPKSRPGRDTSDLARMQGTWEVIERRYGSGRLTLDPMTQVRIHGKRFEFCISGEVRSRWQVELDPAASPPRLDRHSRDKHFLPDSGGSLLGLYRFEGDRLILCYSTEGRPTTFDAGRCYQMVLRRPSR